MTKEIKNLMKKIFKYVLKFIGVLILVYIIKVGLLFSDLHPFKLSEEYYLIGHGSDDYTIQKGFFGKTVVSNMNNHCSWIITPGSIHGYLGGIPSRYFYLDKETSETNYFINRSEFKKYLKLKGQKPYDMSDEESLVHLKYGNGRDRKYK